MLNTADSLQTSFGRSKWYFESIEDASLSVVWKRPSGPCLRKKAITTHTQVQSSWEDKKLTHHVMVWLKVVSIDIIAWEPFMVTAKHSSFKLRFKGVMWFKVHRLLSVRTGGKWKSLPAWNARKYITFSDEANGLAVGLSTVIFNLTGVIARIFSSKSLDLKLFGYFVGFDNWCFPTFGQIFLLLATWKELFF